MKPFLRILLAMVVLAPISAFANSADCCGRLNAYFYLAPNDGSGDNFGGVLIGQGVNLYVAGGTPFPWFNAGYGYAPGSAWAGATAIDYDTVFGTVGSQNYGGNIIIYVGYLYTGSFTFPTNGKNFTVAIPATLGTIEVAGCSNVCTTYFLSPNPGQLKLSFYYSNGEYYPNSGTFANAPEPGTLGLLATGLVACFGWRWRKHTRARAL